MRDDPDQSFYMKNVRPLENKEKIFEVDKYFYIPYRTLPCWSTPDAALKLTYYGEPLY